jgi:hypothetical protein
VTGLADDGTGPEAAQRLAGGTVLGCHVHSITRMVS